jgi:5-carboxymethyl-2-hydroxymuconate isomerase
MPHLVILYTANLEHEVDISGLCRTLCDNVLAQRDSNGRQIFPTGGTRVLAYPAAHSAVADGKGDYGFLYMNLRIAKGRSQSTPVISLLTNGLTRLPSAIDCTTYDTVFNL